MRSRDNLSGLAQALALAAITCGAAIITGCGMEAAPQPPSLKLPVPVSDLSASRNGDAVVLTWTIPRRDTSKVNLTGDITARICRQDAGAGCTNIATLTFAPGANATFNETLPSQLTTGAPRPLSYFVELDNQHARSAGLSNAATVLAGQSPAAVEGLSAEVQKDGVAIHWTPGPPEPYPTQVRLERTLLNAPSQKPSQGPLSAPSEPVRQNLLVPTGSVRGRAIDKDIQFGEAYEYRARRIARITVDGKEVELDGPLSSSVHVDAQNIFAPSVPSGLAAVAAVNTGNVGSSTSLTIDLSWQPVTDSDLAGYAVYRRDAGEPANAWQRISGDKPVAGPGFSDASVRAGHTYEYAVTSLGRNGRESERSAPTQEAAPEK
jgi:hypothetical protein